MAGTLEEAEARVAEALHHLREVRAQLGLASAPSQSGNRGYGSPRNRSAYCIGATSGTGAQHSSCDGRYHGQRCTCACHGARS